MGIFDILQNLGNGVMDASRAMAYETGGYAGDAMKKQDQARALQNIDPANPYASLAALTAAGMSPEQASTVISAQNAAISPSNVREYQYWNSLPPEQKSEYLRVKRAQQIVDTGGAVNVLDPQGEGFSQEFPKTLTPGDQPDVKKAQAAAAASGKDMGEKSATLKSMESRMPQLRETVKDLSELGKKATYSLAGRAKNTLMREAGMDVPDAAVARAAYISKVDNEVLPLLRETFGAQFTQKEGESLKVTLGDPNKSPAEKDAVLSSFIKTKIATSQSLQREVGQSAITPQQPSAPASNSRPSISPEQAREILKKAGVQ